MFRYLSSVKQQERKQTISAADVAYITAFPKSKIWRGSVFLPGLIGTDGRLHFHKPVEPSDPHVSVSAYVQDHPGWSNAAKCALVGKTYSMRFELELPEYQSYMDSTFYSILVQGMTHFAPGPPSFQLDHGWDAASGRVWRVFTRWMENNIQRQALWIRPMGDNATVSRWEIIYKPDPRNGLLRVSVNDERWVDYTGPTCKITMQTDKINFPMFGIYSYAQKKAFTAIYDDIYIDCLPEGTPMSVSTDAAEPFVSDVSEAEAEQTQDIEFDGKQL